MEARGCTEGGRTMSESIEAVTHDEQTDAVADRLARALDGSGGDRLGLAVGEGALHLALDYPIREAIQDVYADCGDSSPGVLSTNVAQRLAFLLPKALIKAFPMITDGSER